MQRPALQKCIAVALALLVWQGAAMAVGLDLLLPSPWQVACRLWSVWREPGFFATVAFSLLRISGGFALGLVLWVLLAVAARVGATRLIDNALIELRRPSPGARPGAGTATPPGLRLDG